MRDLTSVDLLNVISYQKDVMDPRDIDKRIYRAVAQSRKADLEGSTIVRDCFLDVANALTQLPRDEE